MVIGSFIEAMAQACGVSIGRVTAEASKSKRRGGMAAHKDLSTGSDWHQSHLREAGGDSWGGTYFRSDNNEIMKYATRLRSIASQACRHQLLW